MIKKTIGDWTLCIDYCNGPDEIIAYSNNKGYLLRQLPCVLETKYDPQVSLFSVKRYAEEALERIKSFDEIAYCWYVFSYIPLKENYRPEGLEEAFSKGMELNPEYFSTFEKASLEVDKYPNLKLLLKKQSQDELLSTQQELSKKLKEVEEKLKNL
jgi:hypothetical protein